MKRLFLLLLFLFCVPLVMASSAHVVPTNASSHSIFYDEIASFQLTITNDGSVDKVYSWSINPLEWIVESASAGKVLADSSKTFELLVRPRPSSYRGPGSYVLPLNMQSSDEFIQEHVSIFIKSIDDRLGSYNPSVALGASLSDEVDPRDTLSSQILIRNRNNRQITNMTLQLSSENFYQEETFDLSGLEEKSLQYRFNLDPLVKPGSYEFEAKLVFEGESISQVQRYYDIIPYSVIDRTTSTDRKWFSSVQITELENQGNVKKTVSTNLRIPFYKILFTTIDVEADNIDLITSSSWIIELAPYEKATVRVKQNYLALPILILLAIIGLFAYFYLRNPIVLQKQIIVTGKDDEGVSEMKVRIYLRNRTDNAFYNLRLLDKAPTIADVKESDGLGVLEPTKIIRTEKRGTIIKWDFDSLEAYEERIVTYTIKSKLKIIGSLSLPKIRIKYETAKGKERTAESGMAQIGTKN